MRCRSPNSAHAAGNNGPRPQCSGPGYCTGCTRERWIAAARRTQGTWQDPRGYQARIGKAIRMDIVENATIGLDREIHWREHGSARTYSYPYHLRADQAWPELLGKLRLLEPDHFVLVTDAAFPVRLAE